MKRIAPTLLIIAATAGVAPAKVDLVTLPKRDTVQLTIYNSIGEVIYKPQDKMMSQGRHTVTWSPESLLKGLYYAVLRSEEGVSVVKMVKQR